MTTASQHEELDRAAEGAIQDPTEVTEEVTEEVDEPTPEELETKQRDEENAERSRLGRKVKDLEAQLSEVSGMKSQLERLTSLLENKQEEEEEEILTTKTLENYLQRYETNKSTKQQAYEKDYTAAFAKMGVEDENFNDIWEEMVQKHNEIHTGDPKTDAQINYLKAQNSLLKKPHNPLQGKGDTVKGVNTPDSTKKSVKGMPKLDPIAEEFVKRQGLSPDFVNKALNSDA